MVTPSEVCEVIAQLPVRKAVMPGQGCGEWRLPHP